MNPGKKIEPYPMDEDLRSGPDRHPPLLKTQFAYPDDHQSFNHAVTRCVGVGNCRNHSGGVMCPSYRGTREEQYSTRGRERLLFELNEQRPIDDGFAHAPVQASLDLFLSCKGSTHACTVNTP